MRPRPQRLAAVLVIAVTCGSCGPRGSRDPTSTPNAIAAPARPPAPRSEAKPAAKQPTGPRLDITVRPVPDPSAKVQVEITVDGADDLGRWTIAESAAGALTDLSATDARGKLTVRQTRASAGVVVTTDRAPVGTVRMAYAVDGALTGGARSYPMVTPAEMRANGEAVLLLPASLASRPVSATIRIDGREVGASEVASGFGVGSPREVKVTGEALRRTDFLAGQLGTAVFRGWEGEDSAAWLGFTAFDPRAAAAELAQVRTAMRNFFGGGTWPETYLIVAHPRPRGSFRTVARTASLFVEVGMDEPWSAPLRLALAKQLLHAWIGGQLWIGSTDAEHEDKAHWFTEGFARYFAANLLLRFGTLSPDEYLTEISAQLATQYTSPHFGEGNTALAAKRNDVAARALLVARGALYAARVNGLIRKASAGTRSVDQLVLELLARARAGQRVQPTSAWVDAVSTELGDGERKAFERLIVQGEEVSLPEGALGPCFRAGRSRYGMFDLGFDAATAAVDQRASGVRDKGPARAAGLREGDLLRAVKMSPGDASSKVELTVERDGRSSAISYLPVGRVREGQSWRRIKEVPDERCADVAKR